MTKKDLEELMKDVPDDMPVLILAIDQPALGGFAFVEACKESSGVITLGPSMEEGPTSEKMGAEVFVIMPHGVGATQEELDEMADKPNPTKDN